MLVNECFQDNERSHHMFFDLSILLINLHLSAKTVNNRLQEIFVRYRKNDIGALRIYEEAFAVWGSRYPIG